jgi:hypothetical protein
MEGIVSRPLPSPSLARVEVDQRSREARLRLEYVEWLLLPSVPSPRSWLSRGLHRLCSITDPQPGEAVALNPGPPIEAAKPGISP